MENNLESILTKISSDVWKSSSVEESKNIIIDLINKSSIDNDDKSTILNNLKHIVDKKDLDKYIANSILYYEGSSTEDYNLTKKGTLRKRKIKQPIVYFTEETENAIIEYVNETDPVLRDKIYAEKINYAFYKLAENIIHTFKFYYTDVEHVNHLKHEIVTVLLEKMHLYEKDKGKAYSYFGTIVKRWLIVYNKKNYEKLKEKAVLEEVDENEAICREMIVDSESPDLSKFMNIYINHIEKDIYKIFPKKQDAEVADAILQVFKNCEKLDEFNKKAVFIYIKEMVDVPTPHITKIIKKLKNIYYLLFNEYYEKGYISS